MRWVAAVLALAGQAAAQEEWPGLGDTILLYGAQSVVVPVTVAQLDPDEADAFATFAAEAQYFGAFVVDRGPGDWHAWVYGYQSVQAAAEVAFRECRTSAGDAADCVVFAQVEPQDYRPRLGRVTELGALAAGDFRDYLAHDTLPGKHAAFAISPLANGWGWNYDSADEAEIGALQACEGSTLQAMETLGPAAQLVLRRGELNTCRVISILSPNSP